MKKIALLFGGRSREHEVSLASASYLLSVLSQLPNPLYPIGVTKDGQMLLYRGSAQELLSKEEGWQTASVPLFAVYRGNAPLFFQTEKGERFSPDAVFSVIHGTYGEDGALQGALTLAGIPFFGADTLSSALGMHKALAKAVVSAVGVPVVPFQSIFLQSPTLKDCEVAARAVEDAFGFPVFIKPCVSGSSLGASLVRERSELKKPCFPLPFFPLKFWRRNTSRALKSRWRFGKRAERFLPRPPLKFFPIRPFTTMRQNTGKEKQAFLSLPVFPKRKAKGLLSLPSRHF